MLSEASSGTTPFRAAAELASVAADPDPDRAFETRRRVRAGGREPACSPRRYRALRRSLFACGVACWPSSLSSGSASPIAMLAPPQARHLEPGAVATQEGPSTRTAMLPVPGKSSGNYGWTTFFLQRSFLERRSPLSASPKRGQRRRCATDIGAAARQGGLDDAGYVAYCALRSRLVSAVRRRRIAPKRNMP